MFEVDDLNNIINTPENIRALRKHIGLTLKECAGIFNMPLKTWQKREVPTTSRDYVKLDSIQFEYLLLLSGKHPKYTLLKKSKPNN